MPLSDEVLIKRSLSGNKAAFGQLIERYQRFVFSLCLRVLKQREDAEEAAQDVFIKLYDRLSGFRAEAKFKTWLYTLTYRTAIDHQRSRKPRTMSAEELPHRAHQVDSRRMNADFPTQQAALRELLTDMLAQLPQEEGLIIQLYYLQEQSVQEIAEILDLTKTNVKTKLFRTREKLRKLMVRQWGEELDALRF